MKSRSNSFKRRAVALAETLGTKQAAQELEVGRSTIGLWKRQAKKEAAVREQRREDPLSPSSGIDSGRPSKITPKKVDLVIRVPNEGIRIRLETDAETLGTLRVDPSGVAFIAPNAQKTTNRQGLSWDILYAIMTSELFS